jgi:tetratricopeptide (TPR) repeat protein
MLNKSKIIVLHTLPEQEKEWIKLLNNDQIQLNVASNKKYISATLEEWQKEKLLLPELALIDVSAKTPDQYYYQASYLSRWCKENYLSMKIFALNGEDEIIPSFQQMWVKHQGLMGIFPKLTLTTVSNTIEQLNQILGITLKVDIAKLFPEPQTEVNESNLDEEENDDFMVNQAVVLDITPSQPKDFSTFSPTKKVNYASNLVIRTSSSELQSLNEVIALNPNEENLLCQRADLYQSSGNEQEAFNDYERVIKINPKSEQGFFGCGTIYVKFGDYRNGIKYLTNAIKLNSQNAFAYHDRGFALFHSGDERGARKDYNQAIKLKPDFSQAYNDRGYLEYFLGNTNQALQDYSKAIECQSDYADAYYNRGNIYSDLGKFTEAIADYTEAIRCNPQFALAYGNRGIAYYELDQVIQAINDTTTSANLFYEQGDTQSYQQAIETLKQMQ